MDIRLPPWVDSTRLCHTLIIHPTDSPLNSEEYEFILVSFYYLVLNLFKEPWRYTTLSKSNMDYTLTY